MCLPFLHLSYFPRQTFRISFSAFVFPLYTFLPASFLLPSFSDHCLVASVRFLSLPFSPFLMFPFLLPYFLQFHFLLSSFPMPYFLLSSFLQAFFPSITFFSVFFLLSSFPLFFCPISSVLFSSNLFSSVLFSSDLFPSVLFLCALLPALAHLVDGGRDPEDLTIRVNEHIGLVSHLVVTISTETREHMVKHKLTWSNTW